jgi:L-ascorbate metabolism protein UlaG (beta-lactamase superfamily)
MNDYYTGPVSDHFDGRNFFNPGGPSPKGFAELARWQFGTRAEAWPDSYPSPFPSARPEARLDAGQTRVTAIGHASCLLQTAGLNILFDPVYAQRASPVQFAGPKRVNPPGIAFDALPKIDVLLISHNHYDHMDLAAIGALAKRDQPLTLTPLGNDTILRSGVPGLNVRTLDWWQSHAHQSATIHCVPTQHWSARGARDRMHALWSSFMIAGPRHTLYIIGDTGFGGGITFRAIAQRFPSIDFAWMPIGAYEPQWFMRDQHMNPAEAVQALGIVNARRALGHHWGTFKLTNEAVETPKRDLDASVSTAQLATNRFTASRPGEVLDLV